MMILGIGGLTNDAACAILRDGDQVQLGDVVLSYREGV